MRNTAGKFRDIGDVAPVDFVPVDDDFVFRHSRTELSLHRCVRLRGTLLWSRTHHLRLPLPASPHSRASLRAVHGHPTNLTRTPPLEVVERI